MTHPPDTDEARIRHAFRMIGEEAGVADSPQRPQNAHRRGRALAGALVAAAVIATVVVTTLSTGDPADSDDSGDGVQGLSFSEQIACAKSVVEGDVLAVRDIEPEPEFQQPQVRVTLTVTDWIKPAEGEGRLDIDLLAADTPHPPIKTGEHLLIEIWKDPGIPHRYFRGNQVGMTREALIDNLPAGMKTTCPDFWTHPRDIPGDA